MTATRTKNLGSGGSVWIPACDGVGEVSLQNDHLLAGSLSLLSAKLSLLDGKHATEQLFIFTLPKSCVRVCHRLLCISGQLGGVQTGPEGARGASGA